MLVVDDDPATREMLSAAPWRREGWAVAEADDGARGPGAVAARRPALILLDLMMPEMDGFEFLDELREAARPAARAGGGR